ncbi:MAG: L-histidine N(alpha)-methyltransferase [Bacteroidota bacterium]
MFDSDTLAPPIINTVFAEDVKKGLSSKPKSLSSKYFYDAKGDQLFQQIMAMPEYYLTNSEFEIFSTHKEALRKAFGSATFNLVELGAGDGTKTKILLEHFLAKESDFYYSPIDISGNVLEHLKTDLSVLWPDLEVNSVAAEYFKGLAQLSKNADRKVVLFLGGNIGNMSLKEAQSFLTSMRQNLNKGDLVLIGFDLKKDPQTILDAYNDPAGITSAFNLNLLKRMNRELGANFQIEQFKHWETYHPITGATESFIVSKKEQSVFIEALECAFHFEAWEAMKVELSQKYSLSEIDDLAEKTGFTPLRQFFDEKEYFVDALWEVNN